MASPSENWVERCGMTCSISESYITVDRAALDRVIKAAESLVSRDDFWLAIVHSPDLLIPGELDDLEEVLKVRANHPAATA